MRPDELPFVARRSRRTSKESSCRRIMRLVLVFIPETHIQTNYKCLPKLAIDALSALTDNASSSIKTGNVITFCVSISFCDYSYYIFRSCYYLRRTIRLMQIQLGHY